MSAAYASTFNSVMGFHNCVHGLHAYKLGIVMGQHVDIITTLSRH